MTTTGGTSEERPLERTLFVLGAFPRPTQTFVYRELRAFERMGAAVHVLALEDAAVRGHGEDDLVQAVRARVRFLGPAWRWAPRGLARGALERRAGGLLRWALALPHRTAGHRVRFLGALVAALDLAPTVVAGGYRALHAHFGARQTEVAMCLSRLTGVPYGVTFHAWDIFRDRSLLAEKIAGARIVLTCTRYNVGWLSRIAPPHAPKIHLVHHGVELDAVPHVRPTHDAAPPLLLAVGRLVAKKGFRDLVAAAGVLYDRGLSFRMALAGEGPERPALAALIARLGLRDRVTLLGAVPNARVFELLGEARALAAPSVEDGQGDLDGIPNVLLEAMAMSRPVVGTRVSGIPEVVQSGVTGLCVAPGDRPALADAIATLLGDPGAAAAMGRAGRRLVESSFDVRENARRQLALLDRDGTHG